MYYWMLREEDALDIITSNVVVAHERLFHNLDTGLLQRMPLCVCVF